MGKFASLLTLIFYFELLSIFLLTLIDLRVFGRPVRWTKKDICQAIPSPAELAVVPHSVLLDNTTFAPFFLYRQKLELVDYLPHKTVLVSTIEDSGEPGGIYIPEARLPDIPTTPFINDIHIGRFKSPSSNIEIHRCGDSGVQIVTKLDDDGVDDHGVTLEWHPPGEDLGPVDVYITKISFKKLKHRLRRLGQRQP